MENLLSKNILSKIDRLCELSLSLAKEKDSRNMIEIILTGIKDITGADGGTLYTVDHENNKLHFQVLLNDSLGLNINPHCKDNVAIPDIHLYTKDGKPNHHMIACHCYFEGKTIVVEDAYHSENYDFSGSKEYDKKTGYRTKSVVTIPLKDHEDVIIGIIQLINAKDGDGNTISFSSTDISLANLLGLFAAITYTNFNLVTKLNKMFEDLASVIATAIDDKSPYTGKHCERVPIIAMMIADAASKAKLGPLSDFALNHDERQEMKLGALLHDCGKVSTPAQVVDKATKLSAIFDRIELLETRFLALKLEEEKEFWKDTDHRENPEAIESLKAKFKQYDDDLNFIKKINTGEEFLTKEDEERIYQIAKYKWTNHQGEKLDFLTENEVQNLLIQKGTLTTEEREIINLHCSTTLKMLNQLEYPKHLKNIADIAGSHHETMDGKGFPRKLTKEDLSIQARIVCVADIFEALTASDRPYMKPKTLSEALDVLGKMKDNNHIDEDLFNLFIDEKIYQDFGEKYLLKEQIDNVDHEKITGYLPPEKRK